MLQLLPLFLLSVAGAPEVDMWALAQKNADVLRMSTLFTAQQVPQHLSDEEGISRAIQWCKEHGITHVYLESFRTESVAPRETLARARDRFREAGFMVSGCITPAGYGKRSTGWRLFSCYTSEETQRELKAMSQYAAGLFDEIMIDDFLATDCECDECRRAKGDRPWAEFRTDLMLELSRTHIIEAGRAVNPNARFIIKYPCWHEGFQDRGYDVDRQTRLFPHTWVGTETRGVEPTWPQDPNWRAEPQYRAYWLMRWLRGIGGEKCGGGWYDSIGTSPAYYLEQARQTVLGGAPEAFLFNFGALYGGEGRNRQFGPDDVAALMDELPLHFELARLIHGKRPRGLLGWKPANSAPGPDGNLHSLLGMAGFPVTAAHEFDAGADGFVFGCQVLHAADSSSALGRAMQTGKAVVVTMGLLEALSQAGRGLEPAARQRVLVVSSPSDRNIYKELASLPEAELNAVRDRALGPMGISFHAPYGVGLYLFGDDVAVIESFRDEGTPCALRIDGWAGFEPVLQMPTGARVTVSDGELTLPPRSLVALRRGN